MYISCVTLPALLNNPFGFFWVVDRVNFCMHIEGTFFTKYTIQYQISFPVAHEDQVFVSVD
jgi:hypothetical protein